MGGGGGGGGGGREAVLCSLCPGVVAAKTFFLFKK